MKLDDKQRGFSILHDEGIKKDPKRNIWLDFLLLIFLVISFICGYQLEARGEGLIEVGYKENPGESAEDGRFGEDVALGDLNGDGYDDLIVAAQGTNNDNERAYIYYSQGNGEFDDPIEIDIGRPIGVTTGDVNQDGLQDAIFVSFVPENGIICVFHGSTTKFSSPLHRADAQWEYLNAINTFAFGGPSIVDTLDVNADGIDDIVVGSPSEDKAYVFHGSTSGLPTDLTPDAIIEGYPDLAGNHQTVSGEEIHYSISGALGTAVARDGNLCDTTEPVNPCGSQFVIGVPGADIDLDSNGYINSSE